MLANAGALIHGVIADGASTNRRMWTCLGVDTSNINLMTSITHPLFDDRKIFVFSDTPHLIKCIRNRLYNKRRLRVYVKINYPTLNTKHVLFVTGSLSLADPCALLRIALEAFEQPW